MALNEYLPRTGFRPGYTPSTIRARRSGTSRGQNQGRPAASIPSRSKVFNRGASIPQKIYTWTHKPPKVGIVTGVVPIKANTERFDDNLIR